MQAFQASGEQNLGSMVVEGLGKQRVPGLEESDVWVALGNGDQVHRWTFVAEIGKTCGDRQSRNLRRKRMGRIHDTGNPMVLQPTRKVRWR